jgi:hypothetical protein
MLDIYNTKFYSDKIRCENKYWGMRHGKLPVPTSAIICTTAIIFFAVLIEVIVHISFGSDVFRPTAEDEERCTYSASTETLVTPASPIGEQPQPEAELFMQHPHDEKKPKTETEPKQYFHWCSPSPSCTTRGIRLSLAGICMYLAISALYIRVDSVKKAPYIDPICARHVSWPGVNWAPIIMLNFIPFALACFAFLRALVDCLLGCCGTGLTYTRRWRAFPWMPCMPLFMVGVLLYSLFRDMRWLVGWMKRKIGVRKESKVPVVDDERRGLVDNVDEMREEEGDESEGSTAYGSPKSSSECEKKGDKIV